MNVAVLGYGVEGKASADYFAALGHQVTICDRDPKLVVPEGYDSQLGADYLANLERFDLAVRTPLLQPREIPAGVSVTTAYNEFMQHCPARVIGVTGTKGKGTTSTLTAEILEAAGHKVYLGGNIGVPFLSFLPMVKPGDTVVLELSSYQLIDARYSPQIAVMLMIAEDHLDVHRDMTEYIQAKTNIFAHQKSEDQAIYNAENPVANRAVEASKGVHIPYMRPPGAWVDGEVIRYGEVEVCKTSDMAMVGAHNLQNVCAAITASWHLVEDKSVYQKVIRGFTGLPHRLEKVASVNGVTYINDSFSATTAAAIVAIEAFKEPKVLLLGGMDKGLDWKGVAAAVAQANVRHVIALGATANKIKSLLKEKGFLAVTICTQSMAEAVSEARKHAKAGDIVLLSPGTSSFDMFKNFQDRGEQFKSEIMKLHERS